MKINYAVGLPIISSFLLGAGTVQMLHAQAKPPAYALAEITVTAQRRTERMQDVPIAMQALTSQTLEQLNVSTFDDYLRYLPNVTSANNGPGQNEVFMRGLSAGSQATQGGGSTAAWPNVAVYLDNQSGQLPGRNLDIYAADLNRIEVLEGPQGTLFGAGAEAGAIRYITNEPKLDKTEASVKAGYGVTAHGDPNTDLSGVLNLPLITGTLGVRAVVYDDRRGGYIDNVSSTIGYVPGTIPHDLGGNPSANNGQVVGANTNPVDYQGARLSALWRMNDNWDLLLQQNYQNMEADGYFYAYPTGTDGTALSKGVDEFTLVREPSGWKIAAVAYTSMPIAR